MSNYKQRIAAVVLAAGLVLGGTVATAPDAHAANGLKVQKANGLKAERLANGL